MIRVVGSDADRRTFYDGNGAEVKRQTDTLNEETSVWEAQPTKYYIRSSVLKGQVISEVWANGKKHRTYVRGIGNQTAVQSAYAYETAPLNELVLFEFSDASGMSYRTTDKLGAAAATGDGGEGSPIETDPLGGSVGLHTPFIELVLPYEPEYSELRPFDVPNSPTPNFTSLYAHFGSRVADLPGFGTNWGSFSELGMAQYEERVRNSWYGEGFNTNEQLGGRPGARLTGFLTLFGEFRTRADAELHTEGIGGIIRNWDENDEDLLGGLWDVIPIPLPKNFLDLVKTRLKMVQAGQTKSCNEFIRDVIARAVTNYNSMRSELGMQQGRAYPTYSADGLSPLAILDKVTEFKIVPHLKVGGHGAGGTVEGSIRGGDARVLINQRNNYTDIRGVDQVKMAVGEYIETAIHELAHLAGRGVLSDGALAKAAFDLGIGKTLVSDPYTTDVTRIFKHSGDWGDALNKFCEVK